VPLAKSNLSLVMLCFWCLLTNRVGQAKNIYMRCIYGTFGREITKYTVIYNAYLHLWLTLLTSILHARSIILT